MKISYYVPKGKKNIMNFIDAEIASSQNIKSKETRNSVLIGLNKIKQNLSDAKAYFWNGEKLETIDYNEKVSLYYCGSCFNYSPIETNNKGKYFFVVMDANNCTISKLVGKKLITIWNEESNVPRKHDAGGQSQKRFEKNRELALQQWFKKIANKLKELYYKNY